MSCCFYTVQFNGLVVDKGMESSNSIGSSSYTCNDCIWKFSSLFEHLSTHFNTHNTLEITHNLREGMRPNGRSNQVMSVTNVGDPISHCLVNSIFQGTLSILNWNYLCSKCVHTENIQLLTLAIHSSHVNCTVHTQLCTNGCSSYTVLSSSSFSNDTGFSNTLCKKTLSNSIVNLVCSGMSQVLALEPNLGSSTQLSKTLCQVKRSRSSYEILTVYSKLSEELRIRLDLIVFLLNLTESLRKCLGNELSSKLSKVSHLVTLVYINRIWQCTQLRRLVLGITRLFQPST
mmetsp:Transcript_1741/g.2656  ORF Transcript_1741/g.2656 Transcript_1741/m.2656 type:complete len:288 (-) Transcript_1741:979-1842(-)